MAFSHYLYDQQDKLNLLIEVCTDIMLVTHGCHSDLREERPIGTGCH